MTTLENICKIFILPNFKKCQLDNRVDFEKMLQNAYFLAKIGEDTAENEQHVTEILPKTGNYPTEPRCTACCCSHILGELVRRRYSVNFEAAREAGWQRAASSGWRPAPGPLPGPPPEAQFKISKILNFLQNFANFWRARSRLYRNEILQVNMRLTAFFKLYKLCIRLHRLNLKILAKNRFEKSAIVVKIQQFFCCCKCLKIYKCLPN